MDEHQRDRLTTAQDEWEAAEDAYRDELQRHISVARRAEDLEKPEPLTTEAIALLADLRQAVADAEGRYIELVRAAGF